MRKIIRRVYDPLHTSVQLNCVGGSESQIYNATIQEFIPDRQLVPLVIQPEVYITDPSGIVANGIKNGELIDIRWYENQISEVGNISDSNSFYQINRTNNSSMQGRITIRKNVPDDAPLTLYFVARYRDPRTNLPVPVEGSVKLYSLPMSEGSYNLIAEYPTGRAIYPTKGMTSAKLKATLMMGKKEITNAFYWWHKKEGNSWKRLENSNAIKGADSKEILLPLDEIGKTALFRCSATPGTGTKTQEPPAGALSKEMTLNSRFEKYEYDVILPAGGNIPVGLTSVPATVRVTTASGVLENPSSYFNIQWKDLNGNSLGTGESITIPTSKMTNGELVFDVEMEEKYQTIQEGYERVWVANFTQEQYLSAINLSDASIASMQKDGKYYFHFDLLMPGGGLFTLEMHRKTGEKYNIQIFCWGSDAVIIVLTINGIVYAGYTEPPMSFRFTTDIYISENNPEAYYNSQKIELNIEDQEEFVPATGNLLRIGEEASCALIQMQTAGHMLEFDGSKNPSLKGTNPISLTAPNLDELIQYGEIPKI